MTTDPIDIERGALALIEATHKQDMVAGVAMLTSASRDELIAVSATLATYCVSLAAITSFELAEWIPEQRQRLLDLEAGDGPSAGVA